MRPALEFWALYELQAIAKQIGDEQFSIYLSRVFYGLQGMSPSLSPYAGSTFHWLKLGGVWLILVSDLHVFYVSVLLTLTMGSFCQPCPWSRFLKNESSKRCKIYIVVSFIIALWDLQGNVWVVFGPLGPNGALCIGGLLATVVSWRWGIAWASVGISPETPGSVPSACKFMQPHMK